MYELMMNDEPLVQEEPFEYLDKEVEKMSEIASVNKLSAGTGSVQQSQHSLQDIPRFVSNKSKELLTEEYVASAEIGVKAKAYQLKQIDYYNHLLTEYVKFLMGQTKNENFTLRRSDFA